MNNNFMCTTQMNNYTYLNCVSDCKYRNDPLNKCGTIATNPFDLVFNEEFRKSHCIIDAKKKEKQCIAQCKNDFGKK